MWRARNFPVYLGFVDKIYCIIHCNRLHMEMNFYLWLSNLISPCNCLLVWRHSEGTNKGLLLSTGRLFMFDFLDVFVRGCSFQTKSLAVIRKARKYGMTHQQDDSLFCIACKPFKRQMILTRGILPQYVRPYVFHNEISQGTVHRYPSLNTHTERKLKITSMGLLILILEQM